MTDTSITTSVNIHSTPVEIWDALARVCEVHEGDNGAGWVSFTAPTSGAVIHFFRSKTASPATPAALTEDIPF